MGPHLSPPKSPPACSSDTVHVPHLLVPVKNTQSGNGSGWKGPLRSSGPASNGMKQLQKYPWGCTKLLQLSGDCGISAVSASSPSYAAWHCSRMKLCSRYPFCLYFFITILQMQKFLSCGKDFMGDLQTCFTPAVLPALWGCLEACRRPKS